MDTKSLQDAVRSSHDEHFGVTPLKERLRDLNHQVAELVHQDKADLQKELGDVGWSLLQLCNELGADFADEVLAVRERLASRATGYKIGLLGVSANPITNAHLTMGMEILALTDVDAVWYLLPGKHPWGKPMMPAEHRVEMVRLATARYPKLKVCDFEVVHGDEIYADTTETAEILERYLLPAFPHYQFRWIMGSDAAQSFHQWRGCEWMAEHLPCYIIHRLGYDFDKELSILHDPKHVYFRDNVVTSNISSSLVRERGKGYDHAKLLALVPDIVWDYLVEHSLLDPEVLSV